MSTVLSLSAAHRQTLIAQGQQWAPEECCGLLLGTVNGPSDHHGDRPNHLQKIVQAVVATPNVWHQEQPHLQSLDPRPTSRTNQEAFAIAPRDFLQVQKQARHQNLQIIGIYHSHPHSPPDPSAFDQAIAWEAYSYLILSPYPQGSWQMRSWGLIPGQRNFQEEMVQVR